MRASDRQPRRRAQTSRTGLSIVTAALALSLASACGSSADPDERGAPTETKLPKDALPDGLFADFLDGKFDGTGHPLDAEVWQAESECAATTGFAMGSRQDFHPSFDAAGTACRANSKVIGRGRFTLNLRALAMAQCEGQACEGDVLRLRVSSTSGTALAERTVKSKEFLTAGTWQNVGLPFTNSADGAVTIEVEWLATARVQLDYAELFRTERQLILSPPSGVFDAAAELAFEAHDPPDGASLKLACDELDLTDTLSTLLANGTASEEITDYRRLVTVPAADLLTTCPTDTRLRVSVVTGSWVRATSRLTRQSTDAPCTFSPDTTRVLLTGFEPFPADSTRDNSSEQAVAAFDPASVPGISVMKLTLPVEFDTAAGMIQSVIARCQPDIVVGFGQGRSEVDLETTAYNKKDSSAIAGGVPDNRGIIAGGEPIVPSGPAELTSGLPVDAILADLQSQGIASGLSDDPGRYICNNLFYRIMTEAGSAGLRGGFVHLPRIANVTDADRDMLRNVVKSVVQHTLNTTP
ncbi:MAG: pyroglutamyl-peptidase I [Polyangiaceae bacterium]